jgi:hypothetical protein
VGEVPARDVHVEDLLQAQVRAQEVVVEPLLVGEGIEPDCPSIKPAFFDDDAAARRMPASRTARTWRSASG